ESGHVRCHLITANRYKCRWSQRRLLTADHPNRSALPVLIWHKATPDLFSTGRAHSGSPFFRGLARLVPQTDTETNAVLEIETGFFRCLVWLSIFLEC